jgi:hypothetical protein
VPVATRKRILAEKDLQRLKLWLERAAIVSSVDEVIDGRAESRSSRTRRPTANKARNGHRPLRASAQR